MGKQYVGIDIGASSVKMAVCNEGKLISTAQVPVPENMFSEGRILSPVAMSELLLDMRREHKIMCKDAAVLLLSNDVFFRQISVPPMTAEQLKINLPYEFHDYITGEKDKYYYDYAVTGYEKNEEGAVSGINIVAAATSKENIEEYRELLHRAGMKLCIAIPDEMAWSNLLRMAEKQSPGREYAILDIGHTEVYLHLYHGHTLEMTKVIENAGALIDTAIAQTKGVDEYIAKTYKESNYDDVLNLESCQAVYGSIALEVMKALNFHTYEHRDNNLETVYYCGGGAKIAPLISQIAESISLTLEPIGKLLPFLGEEGITFAAAAGATQQ